MTLPILNVDVTDEPIRLPYGPVALTLMAIIFGFLFLSGYAAWRQGPTFQVPARDFVAMLIVVGFFSTVAYTFLGKLNEGGDILLGALIAAFSAVVALYFRQHDKDREP